MSSLINIKSALESALLTMTPAIDTVFENTSYTPKVDVPFQYVTITSTKPVNSTIGDIQHREEGYLQVDLLYPRGKGTGDALRRADLVRNKFKRGTVLTKNGINVVIYATPETSNYTNGDRFVVTVKVYFYSNFLN
jgi:hypothetical protein